MGQANETVRILMVEDLATDALRAIHHLERAGVNCVWKRVQTEPELVAALDDFAPTVVLSDYSLPQFDGMSALRLCRQIAPDIPFLFLSGTMGEERAIAALHAGAVDYVLKDGMARLAPAIRRAIAEAAAKQERQQQEAQLAHLNRVLKMLGGINGLALRIRDRTELLRETCRLAISVGGYAAAIAAAKTPGSQHLQPVAWHGSDGPLTDKLRAYVADAAARNNSVIANVLRSGRDHVCNNTAELMVGNSVDSLSFHAEMRSVVVLPLLVDGTAIAVLVLAARLQDDVAREELSMLREVAGNLSFGLQYLQRDTEARFLSHFDPQTGLAKRSLFCERVDRMIAASGGGAEPHAVVILDVERLCVINDSFGRRIGDLLLQHIADRLKQTFAHTDQLAHFGGGTFALIRSRRDTVGEDNDTAIAVKVARTLGHAYEIEHHSIPVIVRTGLARYPQDGADAMTLVQNAEAALRFARAASQQHIQYDAMAQLQSVDQLALEHRLRFALERGEFELLYQPKVRISDAHICGAEALLRWRSPNGVLLAPSTFLNALESTGFIVQVGEWVIQQAARDCRQWQQAGLPPVRVAVNVAPLQLRHPDFEERFREAVDPWANGQWGLDIEITEGVLHGDFPAELGKLQRLRESGVRIAIDDFGTGYSSLSRLASLPIDTLKIDRSFVSRLPLAVSGRSLVRTIIALGRSLNMTTVAEGVERPEELELLRSMGCDAAQGFLHGKPLDAARFSALLRRSPAIALSAITAGSRP